MNLYMFMIDRLVSSRDFGMPAHKKTAEGFLENVSLFYVGDGILELASGVVCGKKDFCLSIFS